MISNIPNAHSGTHYLEFLEELSVKRNVRNYLEIGVSHGDLLSRVHTKRAVAVDPFFVLDKNVCMHKEEVFLVQETSDSFFSGHHTLNLIDGKLDLAFIDGMHTFEFLLRDLYCIEAISSPTTLVALHDCLPLNAEMSDRSQEAAGTRTLGTSTHGWWTGDIWKIIPILREYRPDLKLIFVDAFPTGIVFVTNLSRQSDVLRSNYLEIVSKYKETPNDTAALEELYGGIDVIKSADILTGLNHSLYFRT